MAKNIREAMKSSGKRRMKPNWVNYSKEELKEKGYKLGKKYHEEEGKEYHTAKKGRTFLSSDDGKKYGGIEQKD